MKYQYQHVFDFWIEEQEVSDSMLLNATRTDAALVRFFDSSYLEGQGPSTGTKRLFFRCNTTGRSTADGEL